VQRSDRCADRCPCCRRCGRWFSESAERSSGERSEGKHGLLVPEDLRSRDRSGPEGFDFNVGAVLIGVDLQEGLAHANRHAVVVGEHDLDVHETILAATALQRRHAFPSSSASSSCRYEVGDACRVWR